jgi:arylsulfatase A-like enzyme
MTQTGEIPLRTGLTTVGQAGADVGMPAQACTIATALKAQGYATGQFGKNHLGDLNKFLPTVHGFDEFFGYLYHLDAMEDPAHPNYPQDLLNVVGPRNMVHSWATNVDDPTEMPRWGKVGKQKIEDAGTLYPKRMETVDDEIRDLALNFMDKAKKDGKPFFVWLNPTRMHIVTHLSPKYEALRNAQNGWSEEEAGMAQLDDDIGLVMKKLKDMGEDDNTIVVFTTDNGTEVFTWPDGGQTPFAQSKGTVMEGGFRVPAILRWPGHVPADSVQNGIFSGMDWLPTFVAAAGNPNITEELLKGKTIGAICHGPWVLCSAGVLKGRRATCFFAIKDDVINAGAKYMDELMTKYFRDAKFREDNRALFAFASYNAGPGNITKARKEAAKRGFDPNKWFNNVEVIVSEKIGVETTTYVRNIYKYYVGYKLLVESQEARDKARKQVGAPKV